MDAGSSSSNQSHMVHTYLADIFRYIADRNIWVMGVPVSLSHTKYPRNALLFNLAFVVDGRYEGLQEYFASIEQMAMKLSGYLTTLERESEYLFRHGNFDAFQSLNPLPDPAAPSGGSVCTMPELTQSLPTTAISIPELSDKLSLPRVMVQLYESINAKLAATVNVDRGNTLHLKLYPDRREPDDVLLHQVPVPVLSTNFTLDALSGIMSMWSPSRSAAFHQSQHGTTQDNSDNQENASSADLSSPAFDFQIEWDLALRRVIPFIDGIAHVKKICQLTAMELPAVSKALQHLLYYGCIKMLDIFQFSNIYAVQPALRDLYADQALQRAALGTLAIDPTKPIEFASIFSIYSQFQPDTNVRSIVLKLQLEDLNIDIRALIQFGLLNDFIRRIHKYPVSISANASNAHSTIHNVHQMIDGKHSYDEIAVAHDLAPSELDKHFDLFIFR